MAEYPPYPTQFGGPLFESQQTRFKSASEVTTALKRRVVNNYYTNYPANPKSAYASTYTTFKAGAIYNVQPGNKGVSWQPTCCTNTNGVVLDNNSIVAPYGEKPTPMMFQPRNYVINNPQ